MKKFISALFWAFLIPSVFPFTTVAQTIKARAGLNLSTMHLRDEDGITYQPNTKTGFHIGASIERPWLNPKFSSEGGIYISTKGVRARYDNYAINLTYLEIPVNLKYSFDVKTVKAYGTIGAYMGIGIAGKVIEGYEVTPVRWGAQNDFKQIDFGLSVGIGVEVNAMVFGMSYSHGLSNLSPISLVTAKNKVFSISCGYKIWNR